MKLFKPRVTYLNDLVMDIDGTVIQIALKAPSDALRLYQAALDAARKRKDIDAVQSAMTNLGHVYYLTGRFSRAVKAFEEVLRMNESSGNTERQATSHMHLGVAFTAWGKFDSADEHSARARRLFDSLGNRTGSQMMAINQGILDKYRGLYEPAVRNLDQASRMQEKPSNYGFSGLQGLGDLARSWGDYKKSIEAYGKARDMAKEMHDFKRECQAIIALGTTYLELGRHKEAEEQAKEALKILERAGEPTDEGLMLLGEIYIDQGKLRLAEPLIKKSGYDSSLGRYYLLMSEPEAAMKHYLRVLDAAGREGNLDEFFAAYTGLGRAQESLGKHDKAREYYGKAVKITEEIRATLLLSERRNFFEVKVRGFRRSDPAEGLVRVALKQNLPRLSIYPSEVTRARSFADNLSRKIGAGHFGVPEELLREEAGVTDTLASLKKAVGIVPENMDQERFAEIKSQIHEVEEQWKRLVDRLRREYPEYASVKYPRPARLEDASVGANEYVLLLDLVGEGVGIRLIKGIRVVHASLVPWKESDWESDIRKFRRSFESLRLKDFNPELAAELYKQLLSESLKRVPEGTRVTIIPDGILALLPFEALVESGKARWKGGPWGEYPVGLTYVGDKYPLVYYQSLTAMTLVRKLARRSGSGNGLLVMADPVYSMADARSSGIRSVIKLASTREGPSSGIKMGSDPSPGWCSNLRRLTKTKELANNLQLLYGSQCEVLSGMECDKSRFLDELAHRSGKFDSIVFATHGFASNAAPGMMEPFLVLTLVPPGKDGLLTMTEVAGLQMTVDLAALVACQTGVGKKLAGEGVLSMGRAFQCAGARSVMMSLWSVFEESTVMLADELFSGIRKGKSKLQALNEARDKVRKAGFEHPFFWAAFILVGEAS